MTEIGTIMIFECSHQPGGTHIIEDHYIEEVINPDTDEPVGYGELGERVVTSFGRGFIPRHPLPQQRHGDESARLHLHCGRTWDIYDGGIRGRMDDMKLVRGTNVYPRAVEVDRARVRRPSTSSRSTSGAKTTCRTRSPSKSRSSPTTRPNGPTSIATLVKDLANAHEGLRFNIDRVDHGTLPRFELKAKRLVDARPVAQYEL